MFSELSMAQELRSPGRLMTDNLCVTKQWFAVRVKSRCERIVTKTMANMCFEEFLPLYQCRRRWSDRVKALKFPLFPGYVFCRLNPAQRLPILTIPGVFHFVGIGNTPAAIEDAEIAAIKAAVGSGLRIQPWPFLKVGQHVRLDDGPLAGLEGVFIGDSKQDRIVVSVALLQRSIAVAIERHWITPLDSSRTLVLMPASHR